MSWTRNPLPPSPQQQQDDEEEEAALSISDRRTLYLVNIFIGNTARFLNSFSAICEDKLADVHRRILRLDAALTLLEAKLRSTSHDQGLEDTNGLEAVGSSSQSVLPSLLPLDRISGPPRGYGEPSRADVDAQHTTSATSAPPGSSHGQPSKESSVDDHIASKFRRMLHFGVPEQVVKMQMTAEGLDPSILNQSGRNEWQVRH